MDLAQTQLQWLQEQIKNICPSKKNIHYLSKRQRATLMTGEAILVRMKECKDMDAAVKEKRAANNA
jgi:hypothetical protein